MPLNRKTDRGLQSFGAVTGWFVLALILLFAGLSIALIALGAQAYRSAAQTAEENAQKRASVGYVLSRIQAYDAAGAVEIREENVGGVRTNVLTLCEEIEDERYEIRLYCAGGMLREQFVPADIPLREAEDGEAIAALAGFNVKLDGSLLSLHFTYADGTDDVMHAALHSAGEEQR